MRQRRPGAEGGGDHHRLGQLGFRVGGDKIEIQAGDCQRGIQYIKVNDKLLVTGEKMLIGAGAQLDSSQSIHFVDAHHATLSFGEVVIQLANSESFFNQKVSLTAYGQKTKENIHGLLGQTWRPSSFRGEDGSRQVIQGSSADYMIQDDDLFGTDFVYNKFGSSPTIQTA